MAVYTAGATTLPELDPVDSDEVLDFLWDWAAIMAADSDTIVESDWTLSPGGTLGDGVTVQATEAGNVTPVAPSIITVSTQTQMWAIFSAGTHRIENTIRTAAGRVWSRSATVKSLSR